MKVRVLSERIKAAIGDMRLTAKVASQRIIALVEAGEFGILQKFLSDIGKTVESIVKALSKPFTDTPSASEQVAKGISRPADEDGYIGDSASLNPNLGKSDSTSTSDLNTQAVGKSPSDSSVITEIQSFEIDYHLSDNPSATDDLDGIVGTDDDPAKSITKSVTDVIYAAEAFTFSASRSASDSAYGSESLNGVKSGGSVPEDESAITDTTVIDLSKYLTDSGFGSDSAEIDIDKSNSDNGVSSDSQVILASKNSSDSASSTDSGSLIAQNYVDNNGYFDDDYVGVKRTF